MYIWLPHNTTSISLFNGNLLDFESPALGDSGRVIVLDSVLAGDLQRIGAPESLYIPLQNQGYRRHLATYTLPDGFARGKAFVIYDLLLMIDY